MTISQRLLFDKNPFAVDNKVPIRYNRAEFRKEYEMKKTKRILAWIAIILLASMYILSLIFALIRSDLAQSLFRASLGCTIIVPVFLYLVLLMAKAVNPSKSAIIDCVVFDLGGVLAEFAWEERAEELGISDGCMQVIREKILFSGLWEEFDLGNKDYEDVLSDCAAVSPEYGDEIMRYLRSLVDCISPYWYTENLVRELKRRGYKVYYLSNWEKHSREHNEEKGVFDFLRYMDGGVFSYEVHMTKPGRGIYEELVSKYNLTPSRCVFIDDNAPNVDTARELGFAAIRFTGYNDMMEKLASVGVKVPA